MSSTRCIMVCEEFGEEPIEIPLEKDDTLLLSTLNSLFPTACGNFQIIKLTFKPFELFICDNFSLARLKIPKSIQQLSTSCENWGQ
jgi:hypothetical protein